MAGTPNRAGIDVAALVSAFNISHPNNFRGQNAGVAGTRYAQHGIAEPGRSARNRSRDREPRGLSAPITMVRGRPSGPIEATEWTDALADLHARISTMERQQASHGQFMSRIDTRATDHRSVSQEISEDIHKDIQPQIGSPPLINMSGRVIKYIETMHAYNVDRLQSNR